MNYMRSYIILYFTILAALSLNAAEKNDTIHNSIVHKKKYRSVVVNKNELLKENKKLHITTVLENYIWHFKKKKEYSSKSSFDAFFALNIGNFLLPPAISLYDTIAISQEQREKWNDECKAMKDKKITWLDEGIKNGEIIRLERKEFWKECLSIGKRYLRKEHFDEYADAIYEFHDSLNLAWKDSIHIFAQTYYNLEQIIKDNIYRSDSTLLRNSAQEFFEKYGNSIAKSLTWQEQIEYAINYSDTTQGDVCPIKLRGYKRAGKIGSEKEKKRIIENMFSESSCIALKNGNGKLRYGIYNIGTVLGTLNEEKRKASNFGYLKERLAEVVKPGMKLLRLEWEYNKQTFYTTAIVSNTTNRIIYDNVGTTAASKISEYNEKSIAANRYIDIDNYINEQLPETELVQPTPFARSFKEYNMFGTIKYSYAVYCEAIFNEDFVLTDYNTQQRAYSDEFHDCKAEIRNIEGEKGISNECKFFYIMGCGRQPISIEWDKSGRTIISITDHCEKGEHTMKPRWW